MEKNISFLFLGGDERQLYASDKLKKSGYKTAAACFEKYCGSVDFEKEYLINAKDYDAIVLPLPLTRDGENLNAPFAETETDFTLLSQAVGKGKIIFGGKMPVNIRELFEGNKIYDCYSRDDFQLFNAVPTAEGVAGIAVGELPVTVKGSEILVLGFGRTGRAIGELLKAMGAETIIGARKQNVLQEAEKEGFGVLDISEEFEIPENLRMVVNTVPARILNEKHFENLKGCLYTEVASPPYGTDLEKAKKYGVRVILASGLPGKTAPETAGAIEARIIINTVKEESLWRK